MATRTQKAIRSRSPSDWWRWAVIVCATLILCSCRALPSSTVASAGREVGRHTSDLTALLAPGKQRGETTSRLAPVVSAAAIRQVQALPELTAPRGQLVVPGPQAVAPEGIDSGLPIEAYEQFQQFAYPDECVAPSEPHRAGHWSPPGVTGPWPSDEYLCDGGDAEAGVQVADDWTVRGLDQEDTVGHFDTLDGETVVQASNRICIYAPRFASVRHVSNPVQHESFQQPVRARQKLAPLGQDRFAVASTVHQPQMVHGDTEVDAPTIYRERVRGMGLDNRQALSEFRQGFLPFEDFLVVRRGVYLQSEKARLSESIQAAIVWSQEKAVQVIIDEQPALESVGHQTADLTYMYERPPGKPRLRVIKMASGKDALPGETIDFTIRFDNIGDQPIGNVTIIDNLTTRLSYVPETAQCSREAAFFTQENDGESLVLRWEIAEPLQKGEGGIVRFQCRVR